MKLQSQMTAAEKDAFKRRPDVQKEKVIALEYIKMLKAEVDAAHNNDKMPKEEFYCILRGAFGFEHSSMRDPRAPNLKILAPYLLEEIDAVCKKPRVIYVNGHLVVPQRIPELNNAEMNSNEEFNNSNNGYLTNAMRRLTGGKRRKSRRNNSKRTRKNNRR
jgi:hypothetical protein